MEIQTGAPALSQLYVYLTEGCNLACRHCWLAPTFDPSGTRCASLAPELFEQALEEATPLGLQAVKLTGGEPLLHPQFVECLRLLQQAKLDVIIETNGLLCTPEIAEEIAGLSTCSVSVSLDGVDAATHEGIRGVPGSFSRGQQAVRNLAAVGTRPQIILSLLRVNVDQIEAMVELAEELGAGSVKFNIIQPMGRGQGISGDKNELSVPELIELGRYVDTEVAGKTTLVLYFDYPPAFRPLRRIAGDGSDVCGILNILGVLPNGQYALCGIGERIAELVFGTIGRDDLHTVWQKHPVLRELRAGLPDRLEGVCARCVMKTHCLGSCLAQNYSRSQRLWSPFWFCDQAEKLGLFPESRLLR